MTQQLLIVALTSLAAFLASATAGTTTLNISSLSLLASLAQDFNDVCNVLGPLVPLPYVKPQALCPTTGFSTDRSMCPVLNIIEKGLISMTSGSSTNSTSTCSGYLQTPAANTSLQGTPLPFPLSDQRPLASTLPSQLLAAEGASYYWLWKNLLNFELWAGCAATNTLQTVTSGTPIAANASANWLVPPGWTAFSTVWQPDGINAPGTGVYWPFATVIYKGDSVIIFIRGTETTQDWMTDFTYSQGTSGPVLNLPGQVHQGFATVAASLWPYIKAALTSLVQNKSSGTSIKNVYVAGHSLGAAVSTLISYAAQEFLSGLKTPSGRRLKVDALLYAPPNVGDAAFAAAFRRRVNARRIPFYYDLIPQIPCTPSMIGCKDAVVPTPTPTTRRKGLWSYASVPGTLLLSPSGMPQQSNAWSLLGTIYPCQLGRFLRATHICSYNCFLSQYVTDSNNLCLLWNVSSSATTSTTSLGGTLGNLAGSGLASESVSEAQPGSSSVSAAAGSNEAAAAAAASSNNVAGSYCFHFPVTEGPQYPYTF